MMECGWGGLRGEVHRHMNVFTAASGWCQRNGGGERKMGPQGRNEKSGGIPLQNTPWREKQRRMGEKYPGGFEKKKAVKIQISNLSTLRKRKATKPKGN